MKQTSLFQHFKKMPPTPDQQRRREQQASSVNSQRPEQASSTNPRRTEQLSTGKPPSLEKKPSYNHRTSFYEQRRIELRAIAQETAEILPTIFSQVSALNCTKSTIHHLRYLPELDPKDCPGYELPESDPQSGRKGTRIRVYDQDSFDAAMDLQPGTTVRSILPTPSNTNDNADVTMKDASSQDSDLDTTPASPQNPPSKPVAVLNLASETSAGGGFRNGALAQEEALCYRSSLYRALNLRFYPLPTFSALYSPAVIIIRDAMLRGHKLLFPTVAAQDLPVTSVITLAAIRDPDLGSDGNYLYDKDVETMMAKIRIVLRLSVEQGHRKIVLGALGCGAFGNPPEEVAQMFLEVFREKEFRGGWWEDVVFAVLDNVKGDKGGIDGEGNFGVFYRALGGRVV